MKKWIAMLLAALMVFSMAACAAKNEPAADQTNDQTAADTQTSEPAEDTASGEDAAPAADQTAADSDMAYVQSKGTLVVGITTDIIFTPAEMRHLHAMIPGSTYHEIDSPFGHDGFLVEYEQLNEILLPFMQGESFHVTQ